jgi:uncharacterized protein YndB with AHSA1/START domain
MIACFALAAALQLAPAAPFEVQGFDSHVVVTIDAPIETVFDVGTGDVSPWWDHHFSENPAELVIEPEFGGHFYERFEGSGSNGVIHADVIFVNAPHNLRLHGPLGLSGRSVDLVSSWTLTEVEAGTEFRVDLSMSGQIDEELANIVTSVWDHFIRERLKVYVEADCHLTPDAPCPAFTSQD